VLCESPNCGAEIPLVRSFWLCTKPKRKRALKTRVVRPADEAPHIEFEVFEPKAENDVSGGTVTRAKARCIACGAVLPPARVRAQLTAQRGGTDAGFDGRRQRTGGARILAVVIQRSDEPGCHYRLATDRDYEAVGKSQELLATILGEWQRRGKQGLCPVPDEPLPLMSGTFNVPIYGMNRWGDLFTARQKAVLVWLCEKIRRTKGSECAELLACALSRVSMSGMSCTRWNAVAEKMQHTFGRQALPIVWDFAEVVVTADAPGSWKSGYELISEVIGTSRSCTAGQAQLADATEHPLPDDTAHIWFTDPPYYFAVPYADLSDFFFVWLKRALPENTLLQDRFDQRNPLTPKDRELCEMAHWDAERYPHKDQAFFEEGMARAFAEGRRVLREDGVGSVVFAHKTTEGWEALLSGMIRGGWTITGSWPIATEMASRLRARESAALATSVHLICRPRADDAPVGDWSHVLRELPTRVGDWIERLQSERVRGADLVFACIGPALEVYSRYTKVETAEGREVKLDEYLQKVWEVVGRSALAQVLGTAEARARNGAAGAVEEGCSSGRSRRQTASLLMLPPRKTRMGKTPKTSTTKKNPDASPRA
jgi:adenine-specific DNA methylase